MVAIDEEDFTQGLECDLQNVAVKSGLAMAVVLARLEGVISVQKKWTMFITRSDYASD